MRHEVACFAIVFFLGQVGCTGGKSQENSPSPDAETSLIDASFPDVDTRLIVDLPNPVGMVVDETHVYWLSAGITDALQNPGGGQLMRVAKVGGQPEMVADKLDLALTRATVIVDATHLYWTSLGSEGLWKVPKDGGAPTNLLAPGAQPGGLAQNQTSLFFFEGDFPNTDLFSIEKNGDSRITLAANLSESASDVFVDGDFLYYAKDNGIVRQTVDGSGAEETVVTDAGLAVTDIVVRDGVVFWDTNDNGDEVRVRRYDGDGASLNVAVEAGYNPRGLKIDDENTFVALCRPGPAGKCNAVVQAPRVPGESHTLAEGLDSIPALSVDETHVYWLTTSNTPDVADGALHRLSK